MRGVKCHMKLRICAVFLAMNIASYVQANDLVALDNSYPYFVEVMPNNMESHAARNMPVFSTGDFKMSKLRTTSISKLMALRGLPDMRCTDDGLDYCIIIYGASNGAVAFHLLPGNIRFSHGTIYNNEGQASHEVIK